MRESVKRGIRKSLKESLAGRKYLAAIITLADDGTLHLLRETQDFPLAEINPAVKLLVSDLEKEVEAVNQVAMLQLPHAT